MIDIARAWSRSAVVALVLAQVASVALAQTAGPSRDVAGAWRIEQARTEPLYDKTQARLEFGPGGRLVGHTSCNAFNATYTLQGAELKLGALTVGSARCKPLLLEQEDRVLTALELVATARVRDDGLLELRDADGRGVLRATRLSAAE